MHALLSRDVVFVLWLQPLSSSHVHLLDVVVVLVYSNVLVLSWLLGAREGTSPLEVRRLLLCLGQLVEVAVELLRLDDDVDSGMGAAVQKEHHVPGLHRDVLDCLRGERLLAFDINVKDRLLLLLESRLQLRLGVLCCDLPVLACFVDVLPLSQEVLRNDVFLAVSRSFKLFKHVGFLRKPQLGILVLHFLRLAENVGQQWVLL